MHFPIKWLMLVTIIPLCLQASEPRFHLPLDGNGNIVSPGGKIQRAATISGASNFVEGINGKALDVRRQAYDQVTTLNMKLPSMNVREGTIVFRFRPEWNGGDKGTKWFFSAFNDKQFRIYFLKPKAGVLEFSVCAPNQRQVIVKNPLKAGKWAQLAVTWSIPKGEVAIYADGKCLGRKTKASWANKDYEHKSELNFWLGFHGSNRFKAEVADGAYDDFCIYDHQLSANEILVKSLGEKGKNLQKRPLSNIRQSGNKIALRFSYPEKTFSSSRTLFKVKCGKADIYIGSTGSSRKLVLRSGSNVLESPYSINLNRPLTLTLVPQGKQVKVLFDGAFQGFLKLNAEYGKPVSLESIAKLAFEPASETPSADETAMLTQMASPLERTLWTLKDAEHLQASPLRDAVCLNGLWRIFCDESYSFAPIKAGRQEYSQVPGSFNSPYYFHYYQKDGKLEKVEKGPRNPTGTAGWFQRSFTVPKKWAGKRIYLNLEDVKANYARIYLNGKLIDSFNNKFKYLPFIPNARRIDITDMLRKENVVSIFMDRFFTYFWRGKTPFPSEYYMLGLDNVWLESAPSKVSLKNAIAFPSFREKTLDMRADIENPFGIKGPAEIEFAYIRDGKSIKRFTKDFELTGTPKQKIAFSGTWRNPLLWSTENPELYRQSVTLKVKGKAVDALPYTNFGFREVWVENGEFKINGQKSHLQMWTNPLIAYNCMQYGSKRMMPQVVASLKQLNYNTVRIDPLNTKFSNFGYRYYLDETDCRGVNNLMPMPHYTGGDKIQFSKEVEAFLAHYGTHPSIIMWYTDFNTCHYQWNQDPAKLNDMDYNPDFVQKPRKLAYTAERIMRSLDPSRELFQHAGGNSGKIFTSMNYQSFGTPLQEREDWPKQWSKKHTQPLMVVETGFPFPRQFEYFDTRGEWMYAEHAARFWGDSVYRDEVFPVSPNTQKYLKQSFRPNTNMLKMSDMLYRKVVPAWRAYDVSAIGDFVVWLDFFRTYGYNFLQKVLWRSDKNIKSPGAKPESIEFPWVFRDYDFIKKEKLFWSARKVFSPLLVFLGGRPNDFTNKDHAFFSNEKFEKSIVVVNDKLTPQNLKFRWKFSADGEVVSKGELTQKVEPGAILKLPIQLQAPEVAERTDAKLQLDIFQNGFAYGKDKMALQVFPKQQPQEYRNVNAGLYDPVGKTEAMLKKAGFPFRKVSTFEDAKKCQLLIVGQEALGGVIPDFLRELETSQTLALGYKILLFEQKQCNVANLIFESPSYRNAFIRRPDSPYIRGLKTEDFSNWRGSSDTVPEFVVSAERTKHYPRSKWKCGNGGIVAGNVIRKPSYGNFSTIVDCGFNLMFAGLMQLTKERGVLLFCQLDVTSRYGKDPVATRLVDNMLKEMSAPTFPAGAQSAVYIGDDAGAKLLDRMGMAFTQLNPNAKMRDINSFGVRILGKDAVPDALKEKFRKAWEKSDYTFIALPGAPLDILPGHLKLEKKQVFRAELPKSDPLFAGITEADLYYRFAREMNVLVPSAGTIATKPGIFGRYQLFTNSVAVLNLSPNVFKDHFWNREKVSRVWNNMFNNLNLLLGKNLKCFTGSKMRDNTITPVHGEIQLKNGMLKLDMHNSGKVSDTEGFKPIKLGISWEEQGITQNNPYYQYPPKAPAKYKKMYDGYAWIQVKMKIPKSWEPYTISLKGGPIDDADWTYFNEAKIGETTLKKDARAYARKRDYLIPSKLIRFGEENTLMIRVYDRWGDGGVTGPLKIIAENPNAQNEWSPYIDNLNRYDVDAFHNW